MSEHEVIEILRDAKVLARRHRALTGKPLGITGEVAEYEAARILGVKLTPARQASYDATEIVNGVERHLQIKGRCLFADSSPSQRLSKIDIWKEWDAVLVVLVDERFDAYEIYEAELEPVIAAILAPGSKARNERWALALNQFTRIARLRWKRAPR